MNDKSSPSPSDVSLGPLLLTASAAGTIALLGFVAFFVTREAVPALVEIGALRFLSDSSWHPPAGQFGAAPMIVATLLTTGGAITIALPLGLLSAVFANYHAPTGVAAAMRGIVELLAGIPSVVYGFWAWMTIVPWIATYHPPGPSLLAGVLVLAIMILPTVILLIDQALRELPTELGTGAAALGLGRGSVIWRILVPAARRSIATATLLATARALGETMALLLVCGNRVQYPGSPFDSVRTLTANIASEMAYAEGLHRSALFVSGFFLLLLVAGLVAMVEILERRTAR